MIELNVNESTKLDFDLSIAGAAEQDIQGRFFLNMNEMSIVFPAKIDNGTITIKIPQLDNYIKNGLSEDLYDAKLEILADETTLIPWEGQIKVNRPVEVKVKMTEVKKMAESLKLDIKVKSPKVKVESKVIEKKEVDETCGKDHDKKKKKKKSKLAGKLE